MNIMSYIIIMFFFFFQAEDGIRDWSVTGVQTCALPIWIAPDLAQERQHRRAHLRVQGRGGVVIEVNRLHDAGSDVCTAQTTSGAPLLPELPDKCGLPAARFRLSCRHVQSGGFVQSQPDGARGDL